MDRDDHSKSQVQACQSFKYQGLEEKIKCSEQKQKLRQTYISFQNVKEELESGWVLHHKDILLRTSDPKRYNEWRIEDLVPMTREDHISLHHKGIVMTREQKIKISKTKRGKPSPGQIKATIAAAIRNTGAHWWNNGRENKFQKDSPGIGWELGKLNFFEKYRAARINKTYNSALIDL